MYSITKTYEDFNEVSRTETFYFHLTKAEVVEWLTTNDGCTLDEVVAKLMMSGTRTSDIMAIFKDLIYRSYGEKSLDGRRFIKTEEVKQNFMETEAFSLIFIELLENEEAAAKFVNGILPKDLAADVKKTMEEHPDLLKEKFGVATT